MSGPAAQATRGADAWERHKELMHRLAARYGGAGWAGGTGPGAVPALPAKTDLDVLREQHRFIRSEADDAEDSWEVRLARRYYTKLFKEYAVADLSRHKEGRVGLRWRTQREVVSGKGQFVCGAKGCDERRGLASFEVPFAYEEAGERKQALVKVRVCPTHTYQLNYRKHKEAEAQEARRRERERRRAERRAGSDEAGSGGRKRKRRRRSRSRDGGSSGSDSDSSGSDSDSSGSDSDSAGGRRSGKRRSGGREGAAAQRAAASPAEAAGNEEFEAFLRGLMD